MKNLSYEKNKNKVDVKDSSYLFDFFIIITTIFTVVLSLIVTYGKIEESFIVDLIGYLIVPISCVLAIFFLCFKKRENLILTALKPKKQGADFIFATILITIGMLFGLSELNYYFVEFLEFLGLKVSVITLPEKTPINVVTVLICLAILPAIFEEIIFRGLIAEGLKGLGETLAIILSGFLFSIYHMNPAQTVYQFLVGCLYVLIVVKGGSYILTVCSHLFNNAFIILNEYFMHFSPVGLGKILLTIIGVICLVAGVIMLYKKPKIEKSKNIKEFFTGIPTGIIICLFAWTVGLLV